MRDHQVESGDWWVHVKEFYQNPRETNMLFLKYEDMHADGVAGTTILPTHVALAYPYTNMLVQNCEKLHPHSES